jgi:hypothetical protein
MTPACTLRTMIILKFQTHMLRNRCRYLSSHKIVCVGKGKIIMKNSALQNCGKCPDRWTAIHMDVQSVRLAMSDSWEMGPPSSFLSLESPSPHWS